MENPYIAYVKTNENADHRPRGKRHDRRGNYIMEVKHG